MDEVRFGEEGLVPVIAQDATTSRVLMLAYMNEEALRRTQETGDVWYWSRSRQQLWRKGETSGHPQRLREIRIDCDGDALLIFVDQTGPVCHTGATSCFFRRIPDDGSTTGAGSGAGIFDDLFALLKSRRAEMPGGSYTASLLRGGLEAVQAKVLEEAEEMVRAARRESDERVTEEAADLVYHTWLLLVQRGVELDAVRRELERRRGR